MGLVNHQQAHRPIPDDGPQAGGQQQLGGQVDDGLLPCLDLGCAPLALLKADGGVEERRAVDATLRLQLDNLVVHKGDQGRDHQGDQPIFPGQVEGGQLKEKGFSRAGGGGDEHVPVGLSLRPGPLALVHNLLNEGALGYEDRLLGETGTAVEEQLPEGRAAPPVL